MTDLDLLAIGLQVSGRTLRRAASRGLIHHGRERGSRVVLPLEEAVYLRSHWPLLGQLLRELRTLPNVRLAVLFGSTARGEDQDRSDIDLLVRLRQPGLAAVSQLCGRIESVTGRPLQLVQLSEANDLLLADVLRDGRVLVDRDGDWQRLAEDEQGVRSRAERAARELDTDAWTALDELLAKVE